MVVNAMLRSDQNDKKPAIKTHLKIKNKFKIAYWNLCWANRLAVINHLIPLNFFFMLVLLVEYIFLTTFYGLYFKHQKHITLNNFFKFLHVSW